MSTPTPHTPATNHREPDALRMGVRLEILPTEGIVERVSGAVAPGVSLTVTCSPRARVEDTVEVAGKLAAAGYPATPHLAARMFVNQAHVERIALDLATLGLDEVFVVGGDRTPPLGDYASAGELLNALAQTSVRPRTIGVAGYPEGHSLIDSQTLTDELRRKAEHADHVVTQLCFDAAVIERWIGGIREAGIDLPIVAGVSAPVSRAKLAALATRVGVGQSARYLKSNRRMLTGLLGRRAYRPEALVRSLSRSGRFGSSIRGVHLFTFNQLERAESWRRQWEGQWDKAT